MRIGYLAPEFPGQTHVFLWREVMALAELGVKSDLFSTLIPPKELVVHDWAVTAQQATSYLVPLGVLGTFGALRTLLQAGPSRWLRCAQVIASAHDVPLEGRVKLAALLLPSAKLVWFSRQRDIRHIHVASCGNAANVAMFASLLSELTYSLALLGPTLDVYGPNQKNKWRHAAFVLIMSDLLYRDATSRLEGSLPNVVEVVPVGVDLEVVKRRQAYVPWSEGQACRIYACGRLNPVKGHEFLIDAVTQLRDRGIDARLSIAGEDELGGRGYRREVEDHIRQRGAGAYVTLLGAVAEAKHRELIADAHIFALGSLNEGISVALMEAMAMQTPVVATDVGGNAELIETGSNGFLVPPKEPTALADAMEKVLRDPSLAHRLNERSRQKVIEKFDSRSSAKKLAHCLGRVLEPTSR
jgi:glycosyltransferase involved in cell wall biosynthesis